MNGILKWTAIVIASLLLMAAATSLLVASLVDEAKLKSTLVDLANERLNGSLQVNGDLQIVLWPTLSVRVNDLHMQAPAGATEDFAAATEIRLGVSLLPLLSRQIQVGELVVEGLVVHAERDRNGKANWDSLLRHASASPDSVATATAGSALLLSIDRVRLIDATLSLEDRADGTRYQITQLNLSSEGFNLGGDPFRIKGSTQLKADKQPAMEVSFDSLLDADIESGEVALTDTRLGVSPLMGLSVSLSAPSGRLSPAASTAELPAFTLGFDEFSVDGSLKADWSNPQRLIASGSAAMKNVSVPQLLKRIAIETPESVNPEVLTSVSFDTGFSLRGNELALKQMNIKAGKLDAELALRLDLNGKIPPRATLKSPDIDLDYLFPPNPQATAADPAAESSPLAGLLALEGSFEATIARLHNASWDLGEVNASLELRKSLARLERLSATLYGGTVTASGSVDARQQPGALQANMRLSGVDLKPLLMAAQKIGNLEGRVNTTVEVNAKGLNAQSWMASMSGPLQVHIDKPVVRELSVEQQICEATAKLNNEKLSASFPQFSELESIDTRLDFSQGVGRVSALAAAMPSLKLSGDGTINLPKRKLKIDLEAKLIRDLEPLDPACRITRKMMAVKWPLTCKGSFDDDPAQWCGVSPDDVANIAAQLTKGSIKDTLRKGFGGLLNRDNSN